MLPGSVWCLAKTPPAERHDYAGKRGNTYLRRMFIHGARALLLVRYDIGRLRPWIAQLQNRAPRNKVIVAIANKLARIAWAVLAQGERYRASALCSQA